MVSPLAPEEQELRALAAAMKGMRADARPAWPKVWARVTAGAHPAVSRWPTMVSVSALASTLIFIVHFNLVGPFHLPTVAAQTAPGPQESLRLTATQAAAQTLPVTISTAVPQPGRVGTPAPAPLPPGGHS